MSKKSKKKNLSDIELLNTYLESVVKSASKNRHATHSAKYIETYSEGNIGVCDNSLADYDCDYLCSANSGWKEMDMITGNAADGSVQGFISIKMDDGRSVMEHLAEDTDEIRSELSGLAPEYEQVREAVLGIVNAEALETNQFIKQVYYPVNDDYHLLSILPSTVLSYEINNRLYQEKYIKKIQVKILSSNSIRNTGSRLVGKNGHPNLLLSLPPKFLKKSLKKSLNREYLFPDFNIDDLKGVENGCLLDSDLLPKIIEEGKRKGTGNYRKASLRDERKEETTKAFLEKYGYDMLPAGFELHHIVPISQGGADSVKNLIMLSIDDHQIVTAAHKEYFKWRDI
jgi:hypothetical protein